MTTLELLRQTASELASQIEMADEEQLRHISTAVARAAVERAGLSHPVITEALLHLRVSARPHPDLQARVQSLAEQLDALYVEVQERFDGREDAGKTEPEVIAAFGRARAARAVAAALGDTARIGAAGAAYEAIAATDDAEYFTGVAQRALTK